MKDDQIYLRHIQQAIEKIEKYVKPVEYEAFIANDMMFDAVVRELQVIGEATKRFSENYKISHKLVPWDAIAGFRNRAVHEYFDINALTVWETVVYDLPELKKMLGLPVGHEGED